MNLCEECNEAFEGDILSGNIGNWGSDDHVMCLTSICDECHYNPNDKIAIVRKKGYKPLENEVIVVVDRTTPFGNPFHISPKHDRDEVCDLYEAWVTAKRKKGWGLLEALRLSSIARKEDGKTTVLVCHCHPMRCHADTLAAIINGGI
jgi:hypothetical protein